MKNKKKFYIHRTYLTDGAGKLGLWIKNNIFNFFSGCGFLAILIVASAFFVCCVSCCSNKRRPSRITPDVDCGHGTYLPHTTQPSSAILHQNTSYNISNSVPFVSSHCNYDRNSITAEVHTYLCKQRYLYNCTNQLFLLNILLFSWIIIFYFLSL